MKYPPKIGQKYVLTPKSITKFLALGEKSPIFRLQSLVTHKLSDGENYEFSYIGFAGKEIGAQLRADEVDEYYDYVHLINHNLKRIRKC